MGEYLRLIRRVALAWFLLAAVQVAILLRWHGLVQVIYRRARRIDWRIRSDPS